MGKSFRGMVVPGRGYGAPAMSRETIQLTIKRISDLSVVPGTLNLRLPKPFDGLLDGYVTEEELGGSVWRDHTPNRKGCRFGEVIIAGRFRGIIFQGDEPEYPANQVEIMSDHKLREALGIEDGDTI